MVHLIKCLMHNKEDGSSAPSTPTKYQVWWCALVTPVFVGGAWKIPGACWPASLAYDVSSRPLRNLVTKHKVDGVENDQG